MSLNKEPDPLEIPKQIFDNAKSLNDSAVKLSKLGKKYHAAHMAAISIEESSKCILYIPDWSDEFSTHGRGAHRQREEVSSFFSFLYGALSHIEILKDKLDESTSKNQCINFLLEKYGIGSNTSLIECLRDFKSNKKKDKQSEYPLNDIRLKTVYADVENGELLLPHKQIQKEEIEKTLIYSEFCIFILDSIINNSFSWEEFARKAPEYIKDNPNAISLK